MRIVSLLSSATEIVYQLGLQSQLVGISHECDFPLEALRLPRASRSRFDPAGLDSGAVDAAVRHCMEQFGSVYEVDVEQLRTLRPDLVLTQAVCEVCAVPTGSVLEAVEALPQRPAVLSLDAHTLEGILDTVQQVADAADASQRGRSTVQALRDRLDRVTERVGHRPRPRVLALEWLDPPFAPGHWFPEMVELAGGLNLLGRAGARSEQVEWADVQGLDPDVLLIAPCGWGLAEARTDADRAREQLLRTAPGVVRQGRAWLGHSAYFSRSGPRVVRGVEALAAAFHPAIAGTAATAGTLEPWL